MGSYNWENKISMDKCALMTKEIENESIFDYNTFNYFNFNNYGDTRKKLDEVAWENPNLRFRDGYGIANNEVVDFDSKLRYDAILTHGPERRQYYVRNFTAVPDLSKGSCVPVTEAILKNGIDTSQIRQCNRLTETDFDRFVPFTPCLSQYILNGARLLPDHHFIGDNSRDIVRQQLSMNKCW